MSTEKIIEQYQDLFETKFSVSVFKSNENFLQKMKEKDKKSFLMIFKNEIVASINDKLPGISDKIVVLDFVDKKKRDNNKRITFLSDAFQNYIIQNPSKLNIKKFSIFLSLFHHLNTQFMENTVIYKKVVESIGRKNLLKNDTPIHFLNPIQINNYKMDYPLIFHKKIIEELEKIHNDTHKRIAIQGINNMNFSNYIDVTLPCIGPLYNIFKDYPTSTTKLSPFYDNHFNIYDFMMNILNGNNHFQDCIPLKGFDIARFISTLMVQKEYKNTYSDLNFSNIVSFSDEDERLRNIIENSINGIRFTLNDVMKESKKEFSKVKPEYVLPYRFEGNQLKKMKDLSSVSRVQAKDILQYNNEIVGKILHDIGKLRASFTNNPELEENIKKCLGIYVYISITLFYDVYKYYLDQISEILEKMIEDDRYKKLNIKPVFDYLDKISQSLLMYKKILENAFYNLFTPSNIFPRYGITVNKEKGYFEINTSLATPLDNLLQLFPYFITNMTVTTSINKKNIFHINTNHDENRNRFINFVLSWKSHQDILEPKTNLYFGGFYNNITYTNRVYDFFNIYVDTLNKQCILNEIFYKYLMKSFQNYLPIELFNKTLLFLEAHQNQIRESKYSSELDEKLKNEFLVTYMEYMKLCTDNLIQLGEFKKEYELLKKKKTNLLLEMEEKKINSILYYNFDTILEFIVQSEIPNKGFEAVLIKKMKELKSKYEKIIVEKTKEIQQEIKASRSMKVEVEETPPTSSNKNKNNKNKNKNNKSTTTLSNNTNIITFYENLRNTIQRKDIYVPFLKDGKVLLLSLLNQMNIYELERDLVFNDFFILAGESTKEIFEKKELRVLNETFIEKFNKMEMSEKMREMKKILTKSDYYFENTFTFNYNDNIIDTYCSIMDCKTTFISEKQIQKIIQIFKSS